MYVCHGTVSSDKILPFLVLDLDSNSKKKTTKIHLNGHLIVSLLFLGMISFFFFFLFLRGCVSFWFCMCLSVYVNNNNSTK